MALKLPTSWKLSQLKALAFQCGISTSGTKPILIERLQEEIAPSHVSKPNSTRILSIDMGIRNLAYCILDGPLQKSKAAASVPGISAWHRIAVSSAPDKTMFPLAKESFSPPVLSAAAYSLLKDTLLPHKPTHVLIERQRFRSMGSPHILEWTIRVNMFESMLYATLHTLRAEKVWEGSVIPIAPGKVGPFWIDPLQLDAGPAEGKKRNTKIAKLLNKGAKIDLVKSWAESEDRLHFITDEAQETARAYLQKWNKPRGRKAGLKDAEGEELGKLDDLADCLLQGMAWIEWEKNKNLVLKQGVEALDLENQ